MRRDDPLVTRALELRGTGLEWSQVRDRLIEDAAALADRAIETAQQCEREEPPRQRSVIVNPPVEETVRHAMMQPSGASGPPVLQPLMM